MKRLLITVLLAVFLPALSFAQGVPGGPVELFHYQGVPTGPCSTDQQAKNDLTGDLYTCGPSGWVKVSGAGGGGSLPSGGSVGQAVVNTAPGIGTWQNYSWANLASFPTNCSAHNWANGVGAALSCAQPAFSDLSGTATAGQLPAASVFTNQANAYGVFLQDFTSATLKVPNGAGLAPTTSGLFAYDTTNNRFNGGSNGANIIWPWFASGTPVNGQCASWSGTLGLLASVACGGVSGQSVAPNSNVIVVSPNCGTQTNCFQVFDDVQVADTATYTSGGTGGSAATLITTNDNDTVAESLQVSSPTTAMAGYITVATGGPSQYAAIIAAFKVSGSPAIGTSWGANETGASATTITVSVSPTGGSGHVLFAFARCGATVPSINFSDNGGVGNSYGNILTNPVDAPGSTSSTDAQGAWVQNVGAGTYTLTATFGASCPFRSIFAVELSGLATSGALDAGAGGDIPYFTLSSNTLATNAITTTANDLVVVAATVASTSDTFSVGKIGTQYTVTTQSSDPAFVAGDVGKKFAASTNCDSSNGSTNCYQAFAPGTIMQQVSAHVVNVSSPPSWNSTVTSSNFTGYFAWGHGDGAQIKAAFQAMVAAANQQNGATLQLPCGTMFVDVASLFVTTTAGPLNHNISGCTGSGGTTLAITADFPYSSAATAFLYSDPSCNTTGFTGLQFQNPFYYCKLSNFHVWGVGVDGYAVTSPAIPIFNFSQTVFENVWVTGWLWAAGHTTNTVPTFSGSTGIFQHSGGWAAGNKGLVIVNDQNPSNLASSCADSFFGAANNNGSPILPQGSISSGYGLEVQNGQLTSNNCSFNPGNAGSTTFLGAHVTGGSFYSRGDQIGGIQATGGTIELLGSTTTLLNSFEISNAGATISALDSQVDKLVQSSGTFSDRGGNYSCQTINQSVPCQGTIVNWASTTHGPHSITGGLLIGSGSANGIAVSNANWSVPAGSSAGQWGTSPSVACPGTLFASAGDMHKQSCTITVGSSTVGANPVVTITFSPPFVLAPTCEAKMTGGTATLANFTVGVPTATSVALTYQGTPGASTTIGLVVTCGP